MTEAPNGFKPHTRSSPFTDPLEPIYAHIDATQYRLGTYVREEHSNSRGLVHGGFLATLADNAMGLTCGVALAAEDRTVLGMVTINLSLDYVGQAKIGDWLQTESRIVKLGGTLGFVESQILANDSPVARANATFKIKTA